MSAYSDAVLADSPDVYFRLDETTGNFIDIANGHNATPNGTIVTAPSLLASDTDAAAQFDWNGALKSADTSYPVAQIPISVECWININSLTQDPSATGYYATTANANGLLSVGDSNGWGLGVRSSSYVAPGRLYWAHHGLADWNCDSFQLSLNTTYHVVVVFSTPALTTYLNGSLLNSFSIPDMVLPGTGNLALNNFATATPTDPRSALNAMDEVAIYRSALSAARVTAHYNAAISVSAPARDTHTAIPFTRGAGGGGKI